MARPAHQESMFSFRRSRSSILLTQALLLAACTEDDEPRLSIEEFKLEPSEVGIGESTRLSYRVDRHAGIELLATTRFYQGPADQVSEQTAIGPLRWEDEGTLLCTFSSVADWYNYGQTLKVLLCQLDGDGDSDSDSDSDDGAATVYQSAPLTGDSVELTLRSCLTGANSEGSFEKEEIQVVCDTKTVVLRLSGNKQVPGE
jgi:hypothetical protein